MCVGSSGGGFLSEQMVMAFWQAFSRFAKSQAPQADVTQFGDTPAMQSELCRMIVASQKRATASLALWYGADREALPRVGELRIVLDGAGIPRSVIEITEVREGPLDSADAQFAANEGEGDGSLEYWLAEHRRFFARELAAEGLALSDKVQVIFERFRLVWQPD